MIWLAAMALAQEAPATPSMVDLERVEARLYYQHSGRLSDNLLGRDKEFVGWNTIIGEGDAEENADDLLVAVRIRTHENEQTIIAGPVTLKVTDFRGKVLGSRRWESILTSNEGVVTLPLWLDDVTCAGDLKITATYGPKTASGTLVLNCGE